MKVRHVRIALFLIIAVLVGSAAVRSTPAERSANAGVVRVDEVPEEALAALAAGRYFHASRILDAWLDTTPDTSAAALLVTARAAAGWYDWARVIQLLDARPWMDAENNGEGWALLGQARFEREEWELAAAALGRHADVAGDAAGRSVGLAHVRQGEAFRQLGRTEEALKAYDRALALLPDITTWIHLAAAEAAAADGDTLTVRQRLDRIDAATARDWGWAIRVDALRTADDPVRALAAAQQAAADLSSSARRARASIIVAELASAAGDATTARAAYRNAMSLSPGSVAAVDAARAMSEMDGLTASDHLAIGRVYMRHGNYERAVDGIEAWLERARPGAREAERARLELAHALFNGRDYAAAERQFLRIVENASSSAVAAEALFFAGRSQYRDGRTTLGEQTFERVADRYPAQPATARALYMRADLAQDEGNTEEARTGFQRATRTGVGVEEVGFAFMRLGGIYVQQEKWTQAAEVFESYRKRWPEGRRWGQATWWAGVAHERLGRDSAALARFRELRRVEPISYYGGLAAERLGEELLDIPMKSAPSRDPDAEATVADALATYDLLIALDWNDAAAWELSRIRSRFTGRDNTAYALAEALPARGLAASGIAIGWDLFRREGGWNPRLLRIVYPFPFRPLVMAEARERAIDPFLAAGLIRQESMFQPTARSGPGALGLMQVLPETGEALARSLDVPRFRDDMLTVPELNVLMGTAYLKDQLDRWDGRLPLVLGAYNAGPHRVARWSDFPEFSRDDTFTERIPFEETRDYVKLVQQNARIYASLWKDQA